jgi:hypothetical protein
MLNLTANGQLQSQHEYKQQKYDSTGQNKKNQRRQRKINQFRLYEFLHISVSVQTTVAVETHPTEGQWL